jgi:hypothetical protein
MEALAAAPLADSEIFQASSCGSGTKRLEGDRMSAGLAATEL